LGQFAEAIYDGSTQNAGPAIRISTGSGRFSFHGLAAIYVPSQTGIALVHYQGEPLAGLGTVIDTYLAALAIGDSLRIEADSASPTTYYVKVNGIIKLYTSLSDGDLSALNSCIGFVEVFDIPAGTIEIPGPPGEEGEAVVIIKSVDESRVNTTTPTDDSELKFPIGANESWVARFQLTFTSVSSFPDVKYTFAAPPGATGKWTDINWNVDLYDLGETLAVSISAGGTDVFEVVVAVTNGGTPGNVAMQFSQNNLDAVNATVCKQFSSLVANKQA
jgi:hypothetical protein